MLPREDVAQAVFALLAPLGVTSPPLVTTLSRSLIPLTQIQPNQCPAIFQMQPQDEIANFKTLDGMYATKLTFWWFIYAAAPIAGNTPASSIINPVIDAVVGVLPPAGVPFNVDGVPCPIFWDGKIDRMDPVPGMSNIAFAHIEVVAIIPPADPA